MQGKKGLEAGISSVVWTLEWAEEKTTYSVYGSRTKTRVYKSQLMGRIGQLGSV
jgi:hypothetical protein